MKHNARGIRVHVDGYTRVCLTAIAALLTVLIVALWAQTPPATVAGAAEPTELFGDSAGERKALVKAMTDSNAKLDELIKVLKSGECKFQITQAEKAPGGADASSTKGK